MARWVEKIWFESHPLRYLSAPLLWPLSLLFKSVSRYRRQQFLNGKIEVYRAPVPVVVVGNITAGGNGKTPVVVWLVEQLIRHGYRPGVVSRGYGGQAAQYPLVVTTQTTTKEAGDEPVLIFQRTKMPVAVSPKRSEAIKALLPMGVDIIISDDGLQHYQMARDVELVVVDGQRRFGHQAFIPFGPLREGVDRLQTVDAIICNGGEAQENEIAMSLQPSVLINLVTGETQTADGIGDIVAMAGIGHPERFFVTLKQQGFTLAACYAFADHQTYSLSTLNSLTSSMQQALVMTEKDAVKCRELLKVCTEYMHWWYLPVDAHMNTKASKRLLDLITSTKEK